MATNFNENSIVSSGGFKPSSKDTPLDIRTRVETEQDIYEIPNPYIGMIVYVKDTGKRFEILTLKEVDMGLTTKNVVDTYKQFTVDLEEYAKIEDVPTKVSELENDRGYAIEKNIDSKIETINSTINSNTNTINSKINTINSNINTINSEIDNINTDLTNASENIEGSSISVDSKDEYLKDIEIIGNTIQNQNDLADIRSVGDKLENQELYEIPVLSTGKNLWGGFSEIKNTNMNPTTGIETTDTTRITTSKIKVKPNTKYRLTISGLAYNIVWYNSKNEITRYLTSATILDTNNDECYIRFTGRKNDSTTFTVEEFKNMNIQLEEGTQATQFEEHQEHKLTILSPTPLEKVGDVADRIICKDGVWGVEKNISTTVFDGSEHWRYHSTIDNTSFFQLSISSRIYRLPKNDNTKANILSNRFLNTVPNIGYNNDIEGIYLDTRTNLSVRVLNTKLNTQDLAGFKSWLSENSILLKYQLTQPTFIPLPHDQQIKLRTFANKTNISFGCEIEPTLKASVPKSIGATVNTHAEQIDNLGKELDKVKKLEESTVSTVTTESSFTTVTETANGYFEDVKLEGRTLVNLVDTSNSHKGIGLLWYGILKSYTSKKITVFVRVVNEDTTNMKVAIYRHDHVGADAGAFIQYDNSYVNKPFVVDFSTDSVTDFDCYVVYLHNHDGNSYLPMNNDNIYITVLEGDHTQNPPSFFEGLKSVGQDVDEITIATTNAPMFFGKGGKK